MKHIVQNIILLTLALLLLAGIFWARHRMGAEVCTRVDVVIENADSTVFVTKQGILDELDKLGIKVVGKPMSSINATDIEETLKRSEYLERVDCVKGQDGTITIRASQLVPVLRVFDGDKSYYMNRAGKRMAATASYHADVPVVQGHFTTEYPATRLLPMIDYVEGDSLLHSLVTMYCMRDSNNIFIVPGIYGHVVNMGAATGFDNKFAKLKLFYKQVMPAKGWQTYDTISVKWDHQVVATRRQKAVKVEIAYDPEDDEQIPDPHTMAVSDETPTLAIDEKKQKNQAKKNN